MSGRRISGILTVQSGDTVAKLAGKIPDFRAERFRVLDGLTPVDRLTPGQDVKIIVE